MYTQDKIIQQVKFLLPKKILVDKILKINELIKFKNIKALKFYFIEQIQQFSLHSSQSLPSRPFRSIHRHQFSHLVQLQKRSTIINLSCAKLFFPSIFLKNFLKIRVSFRQLYLSTLSPFRYFLFLFLFLFGFFSLRLSHRFIS